MANLVTNVEAAASENPDTTAIGFRGREISYGAFWTRTGQFAAGLDEHGVGVDDRVALYLPNLPQFVTAFHGTLRAGGVVVPMNPQYKSREISHLLGDSGASVVVTLADLVPQVEEVIDDTDVEHVVSVGGEHGIATEFEDFLAEDTHGPVERADDDVACQPYTSGTTGQPKGVQLTHENLGSNAEQAASLVPGGVTADDRAFGALPLFHIYGMTVTMNASLFNNSAYYPLPEWDAQEAMDLVAEEDITIFHGVPAMYNDVINQENAEEFDFSSVRLCGVGGSGIPIEVLRKFEELYEPKIYEGYGLTETSPVTHFNSPERGRRVGSIGKPLPGVDSRIVDEDFNTLDPVEEGPVDEDEQDLDDVTGELVISGPNVMKGYYNLPEANEGAFTQADGKRWFHTGDIGYYDQDDYYYIVDRKKHMINTAGYNVYPREVEELLFEHPDVADVAVVGIPDERRGETVKAFVVPTPGSSPNPDELRQYCLDNLAEYKHPREIEFVQELPRTTTGKVQKYELVEEDER